jgi:hypothetical protein
MERNALCAGLPLAPKRSLYAPPSAGERQLETSRYALVALYRNAPLS